MKSANACLRCHNSYNVELPQCPKCHVLNYMSAPWIPLEDKIECSNQWKQKDIDINRKMIKTLFKKILREYNIRPGLLKVREGKTGLMEIKFLTNTDAGLKLTYNPVALSFYDLNEIESYHPLTQTGGPVSVPNMSPETAFSGCKMVGIKG